PRPLAIAGHQRYRCREPTTSARPPDGDGRRVDGERLGVGDGPVECGVTVVGGGREGVLGGEAIVHTDHYEVGMGCVGSAHVVEQTDLAEDERSSVEVNEAWADTVRLGPIDADRDLGSFERPRNALVANLHLFSPWL